MADKLSMFGKSYSKVGDNSANLCLCTSGDVTIKTANRFVPIFKNGKLAVDDTSEIFVVSSESEIKRTGVYLVNTTNAEGEAKQSVFLYIDGVKVLLASDSDGYISYTTVQNLKAEQFLQALKNLGMYFQTLEDAKAANLTEGLVYTLTDQKLYKIVNGELVEISTAAPTPEGESSDKKDPEEATSLQIGGIFIDGVGSIISGDSELIFQAGGSDYIWFKLNKVFVRRDLILSPTNTLMFDGSQTGQSGFMVYTKNSQTYLEVDNIIVRNQQDKAYEPQIYPTYVGTSVQNQIVSAGWVTAPHDISLELKYQNKFAKGDYILVQTTGGNRVSIEIDQRTVALETGEEQQAYVLLATLQNPVSSFTTLQINFSYTIGDSEESLVSGVLVEFPSSETFTESSYITLGEITSVDSIKILRGDSDIYYGNSGGLTLPSALVGTVSKLEPFTVNLPTQSHNVDSVLDNLKLSNIYKIGTPSEPINILYHVGNSLSLLGCSVVDGNLVQKFKSQVGDLSIVTLPDSDTLDEQEQPTGYGIYSDNLIAVDPQFYGSSFKGIRGIEYPTYDDTLVVPEDGLDDPKYDRVVPCLAWVRKISGGGDLEWAELP